MQETHEKLKSQKYLGGAQSPHPSKMPEPGEAKIIDIFKC
jgi:hypothetical protein